MPNDLSFDDVVEEHRLAVGAERVHLSLAPGATPEGVAANLREIREKTAYYESFSELEREKAKVARMRATFRRIGKHCQRRLDTGKAELERRLSDIFGEVDLIPEVDMAFDVDWMEAEREKAGLALPEKAHTS